jgi:ABC-type microcin C transport system duplicated ATPase subunit YejF
VIRAERHIQGSANTHAGFACAQRGAKAQPGGRLRALVRLLPEHRVIIGGRITVDGHDVLALSNRDLSAYRGRSIAMIFQEPGLALDPVYRVGDQIAEAVMRHDGVSRRDARALAQLEQLGRKSE